MINECPFCWSRNIKQVGAYSDQRGPGGSAKLMECGDCEKWYWADRGREAPALFLQCRTAILHPQRCLEEIRRVQQASGTGIPRSRLAEFNHLCTECPYGKFAPGPDVSARHGSVPLRAC
jgi:hypothetical protein